MKFYSRSALEPNVLHSALHDVLLAYSNVPDVLEFRRAREWHFQISKVFNGVQQTSEQITSTAARNV